LRSEINELHWLARGDRVHARTIGADVTARTRLQIGDWWADPATNELGRAGETQRIEPKVMEVLMVLASRPGAVVSREELLSLVWPGVVVGDEALTQSIIKLRRALGDNPRSPVYVETISKRGYRLVAPVGSVGAAPAPPTGVPVVPAQPPVRVFPLKLAAGLVLVLLAAFAYLYSSSRDSGRVAISDLDAPGAWDSPRTNLLTVTVLPFEWLGAGDEHAYLARGIGTDLVTELSRLSGLRLISAPSAKPDTPAARNARYVVSGSVQRESATLRVNVRLIDARTNEQLWSERYERPFRDLFAVQDEIIRRLVEKLPGKVSDAERQRLAKRYTRSLDAYEHFLRGQALFMVRRTEDNQEARSHFQRAIELDANFARAYASLAMTHAMDYRLRPSGDTSPSLARAFALAESARLIDPDIPEIHWALGFVHVQSRRHDKAIESLRKALGLDPSYADAYALMGGIYTYTGQPQKTIPLLRTALRLSPDGGYLYYQILGRAYLFGNDIEQALINLREASARNPVDLETRVYLAAALIAAGDRQAAEWEAEEIRALDADFSMRKWLETYPMTSAEHRDRLSGLLAKVGL
jgi:DNA-binding winged helix-turn-helix (wHTH) protein/TolB-like protein/Tfp pilus assembly protein PilF